MKVSIDFETRSQLDLPTVGLDNYARHPSTEVICMAYCLGDEDRVRLWTPLTRLPHFMMDPDTVFQAWNASFERNILYHVLGVRVKNKQFVDTMAMAAACNVPQSLEEAAIFLGVSQQKDPIGKRLINKLSKPQKDGTFNQDPELLSQMYDYCRQDVRTEMAVASKLRNLTPSERFIWTLTQRINNRGIPIAVDECMRVISSVDRIKSEIDEEIRQITGGIGASQPSKLLAWLRDNHGIDMPDMTSESVSKMLQCNINDTVRRVLELREHGSSTSVAKYEKMLEIQNGGRIRNLLVYHGASTGRWASRGGLNVQNLPRPQIKDEAIPEAIERILVRGEGGSIPELSSLVRSVLKAPEGYTFIDADFSSIENRVGVWIPNQKTKLEMFRQGLDEYKVFASESLYNLPYDEVTKDMRQVSKSAVLGCLFGQGAKGLVAYAEGMGVKMDMGQAEIAVKKYRESYFKVKSCWYEMEQLAIQAIQNPGQPFGLENGRIVFKKFNNALWMRLPSTRLICWQSPCVGPQLTPWGSEKLGITVRSQNTFTRKWGRNNLIGSSIFQSAVQGTARDLLAFAMTNLDKAGYSIVGAFHDEILLLDKEQDAEIKLSAMIDIMTTQPEWAQDIPLAAEGWVGTRFRK